MKKMMWLGALLLPAIAGHAQESRQDASISGFGLFTPDVHGNTPVQLKSSKTGGGLASYRFMLTPRSALEANYGFAQNTNYFQANGTVIYTPVHTRQQELSAAYVYSRNYRRYIPFVELGPGAMLFSPIRDQGTGSLDLKRNTSIGAIFGGGVAYELSPSFDIRAEFRGFFVKAPSFQDTFKTNRYTVVMTPSIGVAYHF